MARLEQLWANVEARWQRTKNDVRPLWDDTTLAMARSIIRGDAVTPILPPRLFGPVNQTIDTELLGIWFTRLVKDFPGVNLSLDDPVVKEEVAHLASVFQAKADRLKPASKSTQTLHQALDAYKAWLHAQFLTPPEKGKERRTSQTGVEQGERTDRLKRYVEDMPLSRLGVKEIEAVVTFWANRLVSSRGTAFAATLCKHQIRLWKHFLKWLHKEPSFAWKKPEGLEWDRVKSWNTRTRPRPG